MHLLIKIFASSSLYMLIKPFLQAYADKNICSNNVLTTWADQGSFVRGGPDFFSVDEWWEYPNTTISGSSSARHLNDVSLACR